MTVVFKVRTSYVVRTCVQTSCICLYTIKYVQIISSRHNVLRAIIFHLYCTVWRSKVKWYFSIHNETFIKKNKNQNDLHFAKSILMKKIGIAPYVILVPQLLGFLENYFTSLVNDDFGLSRTVTIYSFTEQFIYKI